MSTRSVSELKNALSSVLDSPGFLTREECGGRYLTNWAGSVAAPVPVLRPATPEAVAAVVRVLHGLGQAVAVQGGMTGLVSGALPRPGEVVLSLERLNRIESVDRIGATMTVQSGVALETVQSAALENDLYFPVDIGSRGSCQIGGLIATNAGGNRVLRYGMTRNSILGLEVVLPDGRVLSHLSPLRKDNTGYDLKHLFIGSEGTLGIVTRATLSLEPHLPNRYTALVSATDFSQVVELFHTCRKNLGANMTSFEVMWRDFYDIVVDKLRVSRRMFDNPGQVIVLVEMMTADVPEYAEARFTDVLCRFLELHEGSNITIAQSLAEGQDFWRLRDASGEAAREFAPYAGFDVSLPIAAMEKWVEETRAALQRLGVTRTQFYGHLGDGNLHLVVPATVGNCEIREQIDAMVYHSIGQLGGSISAEHGIGMDKKKSLGYTRSDVEIDLMRTLKQAIDPQGLFNRGRIFDVSA